MKCPDDDAIDQELMSAVGRQDNQAFARLLNRHSAWSLGFAERMLGSRSEAEDLVQNAFLKIWQGASIWQPRAKFSTWLYRILHNLCMDQFRVRSASFLQPLDESIEDNYPDEKQSIEATYLDQQRDSRVRTALAQLAPRQRAAIVLCYYEERSQAEAAALLEVTEGALESLLSRARASLRKWLQNELH
jgi:RNA polymerase sigma-70 factor, ECF subfamily